MNTANKVDKLMAQWKSEGISDPDFVVKLANACLGWSYVFGARGEKCTPSTRRKYYSSSHHTIKSKCKNFEGTGSCSGCKWYPGGATRCYDCRGFTYWLFMQIGIKINGAGATSQYNTDANWALKGPIGEMPRDRVCCVFRAEGKTMQHTLLYDGQGHYIHDNGEVRKVDISKYNATHYAIPKGLYGDKPEPQPTPTPTPTPEPAKGEAVVTGKQLALRKGPGTNYGIITRIPTGTIVKIATPPPSDWEYVEYNGKKGYVMKEFIKEG